MADREVKQWNRIVDALWKPDRILNRIENGVVDGMPDAYTVINGVPNWMELKAPLEPSRSSTPLFSGNHKLSQAQANWLLAHRQAGGRGWVCIESETRLMLIGARWADVVNKYTLAQLEGIADFCVERPVMESDWRSFERTLTTIKKDNLP